MYESCNSKDNIYFISGCRQSRIKLKTQPLCQSIAGEPTFLGHSVAGETLLPLATLLLGERSGRLPSVNTDHLSAMRPKFELFHSCREQERERERERNIVAVGRLRRDLAVHNQDVHVSVEPSGPIYHRPNQSGSPAMARRLIIIIFIRLTTVALRACQVSWHWHLFPVKN